ncbi:B-cell antigen receptor complex-associated protein alpha chain-like [Thalassophryne amazonica]|uniref:B-cell antigen receptor complex-associated protein alpha chain-like n=1 Tax=Thalassophryne amazonica TaxID=390379 RepID=UPI001470BDE9|nr:B-cell antigen receptor complex-associated protein alpha chain-like [Thalassophryne amazonica]
MMGTIAILFLCSFVVGTVQVTVTLEADRPLLKVWVLERVQLQCCFNVIEGTLHSRWVMYRHNGTSQINKTFVTEPKEFQRSGRWCDNLNISLVQMNDSGLYLCLLSGSKNYSLKTLGTHLWVYESQEKILNFSESTKNKILTAEGILLFLCVILPSTALLFQSKKISQMEKNVKKQEENIYQGLTLDDCGSIYEQIEHCQVEDPYEDAGNMDFHLAKP